jgi:hypothetical protein
LKNTQTLRERYRKLDKQTFVDFVEKSQQKLNTENIRYPDAEVVVFRKELMPDNRELYNRYPNWNGAVLEFSNVGVNKEKNQGLVYYGFSSGKEVGGGIYIIYERKKKKWKRKMVIPAWAA